MLDYFEDIANDLKQRNLFRAIRTLDYSSSVLAKNGGVPYLLFCGNDYLGLSRHPRVVKAAEVALRETGVGSGAARLISGSTPWHDKLEAKIAEVKGKEKALLFSSGYQANVGILSALAGSEDVIIMDKLNHASIIDGARLSGATVRVFPHKNYEKCDEILEKTKGYRHQILVSETVFSMDGDIADLKKLVELKKKHSAFLMVDDAHGTGVLGATGGGALEDLKLQADVDIVMGTLSKAMGCIGGFAAVSGEVHDFLVNHARTFIFATSLPPMICAAAHEAFCLLKEEPEIQKRLWHNIQRVHDELQKRELIAGEISSPIFPVILGEEETALHFSKGLQERGILVPAIRPPTVPKKTSRLRITVSAAHTDEHLNMLFQALDYVKGSLMCHSREGGNLDPRQNHSGMTNKE